jgi:hypothetical protein
VAELVRWAEGDSRASCRNRKKGVLMSKGFLRPISKAGRMRIRRRSPLLAGLVALFTVFSIALGGTPAWASATTASYTYYDCLHAPYKSVSSDGGAVACFFPDGEWFGTCDSRADGHHAEGLYERPGDDVIIVVNTGYGTCGWFNDDLVEGTTVYIRAANCEGSSVISWGPRITAKA